VNLVYYECPGICTPLINGLSDVIKQSDMVLGTQYQIVTLSFDHDENSDLARKKKNTYIKINSSDDVKGGWTFLTGDSITIATFLDQIGFKVKKDGEEYIHPAALIMVSPQLKITRYLNGVYFNPFDYKLALVEASEGRSGPTINKVLDYCFSYDPQGKKYVFNITKVAGSMVVFFAALLLFSMLMVERKRKKRHAEMKEAEQE
jgi:protein SCO1/2